MGEIMAIRKARLSAVEDKAWAFAFLYYLESGASELKADRLAWRDIKKEFPRLAKFQGCHP